MGLFSQMFGVSSVLFSGQRVEDVTVCHLEGDSMHSMTTNDGRIYGKYDKFKPSFMKYEKYDMSGIKISMKRSNLVVRGSHSNWGKNCSMKRKTSVMRVTKPLR